MTNTSKKLHDLIFPDDFLPRHPDDIDLPFLPPSDDKLEHAIEAAEKYDRHLQRLVEAREVEDDPWHDISDAQLGEKVQDHLRLVAAMVMRLEARHAREKSNEND